MNTLKQGMAAVALVATLGLVVPSTLGGVASADISEHNPKIVETTFHCDLDGNGTYETDYHLVSTPSSTMWQDTHSTTVIVQRLRVDVLDSFYEVLDNPTGTTAPDFADPDVYWFDGPQSYPHGGGKPKGWKTVPCTEVVSYEYPATVDDAALGIGFVEGVTYLETDTNLYDVTISSAGSGASNAANASHGGTLSTANAADDDKHHADRQHKAKNGGKHHTKGKHRR